MIGRARTFDKVFGIGSAKTGTTTLRSCLIFLGFTPHVRWSSGLIARCAEDPENVLRYAEKYRSFQDVPWCYGELYEKLDHRFPHSKFILTERSVDNWMKSFIRFKTPPGENRSDVRYRFKDPQLGILSHGLWWGVDYDEIGDYSMEPHEDTYRSVYLSRNEGIKEYFRDRPDDLLVVDWENGDGWPELCSFLGTEIPSVGFPQENIGADDGGPMQRLTSKCVFKFLSLIQRFR
ncbi:MAG: hypothetical protein OEU36_11565 [Gammaproteobacteria bacterium]|nr:hypothetical protein [Gammaproteobacteria bacterium]